MKKLNKQLSGFNAEAMLTLVVALTGSLVLATASFTPWVVVAVALS
jgi:hypothetical protein